MEARNLLNNSEAKLTSTEWIMGSRTAETRVMKEEPKNLNDFSMNLILKMLRYFPSVRITLYIGVNEFFSVNLIHVSHLDLSITLND